MTIRVQDLLKKKPPAKPGVQAEEIADMVGEVIGDLADKVEAEPPKTLTPMQKLANTLAKSKEQKPAGEPSVTFDLAVPGQTSPVLQSALTTIENMEPAKELVVAATPNQQMQNPTMADVSNYVFEEQPEESTLEITNKFDSLLESLVIATGNDIPDLLAKNLEFLKEHAFLSEILKPESIGHLCNAMRKSYGHVVQAKNERTKKTSARVKKENDVMDSLASIDFGF